MFAIHGQRYNTLQDFIDKNPGEEKLGYITYYSNYDKVKELLLDFHSIHPQTLKEVRKDLILTTIIKEEVNNDIVRYVYIPNRKLGNLENFVYVERNIFHLLMTKKNIFMEDVIPVTQTRVYRMYITKDNIRIYVDDNKNVMIVSYDNFIEEKRYSELLEEINNFQVKN